MCSAAAAVLSKAKEKVLQVVSVSYSKHFWLICCINRRTRELIVHRFLVESLKKKLRQFALLFSRLAAAAANDSVDHIIMHTHTHTLVNKLPVTPQKVSRWKRSKMGGDTFAHPLATAVNKGMR